MEQEVLTLQHELNSLIKESGFFGGIVVSQEGLVVLVSQLIDPAIEVDSLAAMAASIFNESGMISENPEDVVIAYPDRKVFIQKLPLLDTLANYLFFITIIPNHIRHFRRNANKIAKISLYLVKDL